MTQKTAIGEFTAVELLELYQRRQLSPVEVVDDVLARIDLHNPAVNAYCHVDGEGPAPPPAPANSAGNVASPVAGWMAYPLRSRT